MNRSYNEVRYAQLMLLAEMAGAMDAWSENDSVPEKVREHCANFSARDTALRAEAAAVIAERGLK
jgi:hypothetical protein